MVRRTGMPRDKNSIATIDIEICIPPWIEGSSGLPDLPWFGNAIFRKGYAVTVIVYSVPLSHAG